MEHISTRLRAHPAWLRKIVLAIAKHEFRKSPLTGSHEFQDLVSHILVSLLVSDYQRRQRGQDSLFTQPRLVSAAAKCDAIDYVRGRCRDDRRGQGVHTVPLDEAYATDYGYDAHRTDGANYGQRLAYAYSFDDDEPRKRSTGWDPRDEREEPIAHDPSLDTADLWKRHARDPSLRVQLRELREGLADWLTTLSDEDCQLCALLMMGHSLRSAADALSQPYSTVRDRKNRLLESAVKMELLDYLPES